GNTGEVRRIPFGIEFFDLPAEPRQHVDVTRLFVDRVLGRRKRTAEFERSGRFVDYRRVGGAHQERAGKGEKDYGSECPSGSNAAERRRTPPVGDEIETELATGTDRIPTIFAGRLGRSRASRSRVSHSLSPHHVVPTALPPKTNDQVSCLRTGWLQSLSCFV